MGSKQIKMTGIKFVGVDVVSAMKQIVDAHTVIYKSDFEYDRERIMQAAQEPKERNRTFLWLCRSTGTWLLKESDVLLRDTVPNVTFCHYCNEPDDILAYAVEITGTGDDDGSVLGNIYALNYGDHCQHILVASIKNANIVLTYQNGTRTFPVDAHITSLPDPQYGEYLSCEYQPASQEELTDLLAGEKLSRKRFVSKNFNSYLMRLQSAEKKA